MRAKTKFPRRRGKGKKPSISCPERHAWLSHRHGAIKRGIDFNFTYEEWVAWWKHHLGDDWFALRGKRVGQYVMARIEDVGPYEAANVKSITCGANIEERLHRNGQGLFRDA